MPRWTFEPKITLGNVLTILSILITVFGATLAFGGVLKQVEETTAAVTTITGRLDAKDAADAALLAALNQDRVNLAGKLSEMATDIRYLRREREAEKREATE